MFEAEKRNNVGALDEIYGKCRVKKLLFYFSFQVFFLSEISYKENLSFSPKTHIYMYILPIQPFIYNIVK